MFAIFEFLLGIAQWSVEILFVDAFGFNLVVLIEIFFKISGNTFGDIVVVNSVSQFKTLSWCDFLLTRAVNRLQVFPDTDGVIKMIIGTEASHMVLASLWEGLIKLEGFEEDEE